MTPPDPPQPSDSVPPRDRRRAARSRWIGITALALLVVWSVATARLFVWPDLPALPPTVDAIVELGGPGERDDLAVALAEQGRARYLVQSATAMEMRYNQCLPPVPNVTIVCFHPDPFTTRGEARAIAAMAAEYGWRSIILVTSADQAWRATVRVDRCFDGDVYVAIAPLAWHEWPHQIIYQWGATVKAFTYERSC